MKIINKLKKFNNNIENFLSKDTLNTLDILYNISLKENENIFLVGGIVRDIIMGRSTHDIDIVYTGDVFALGTTICNLFEVENSRFNKNFLTFNISLKNNINVDIATPRTETYKHSGALPTVKKSSLEQDYIRRDFTINSLYIKLDKELTLIDYCDGKNDITNKKIKILHNKSFIDDPTRIFRAIKFLTRYDFSFESDTEKLLKKGIADNLLLNISIDRFKNELFHLFQESNREKIISNIIDYNVFSCFNTQSLKINSSRNFLRASKEIFSSKNDIFCKHTKHIKKENILLFLFFMENDPEKIEEILKYFNFSKKSIKYLITLKEFYNSSFN
ncbi:hypothetical protein [Fusobacterium sp. MFO224]|uniref:hypothetical protein n=1 Tax=Fusobacterium sp. MFO224 TaxID=3378070 RepID=UPI00385523EE